MIKKYTQIIVGVIIGFTLILSILNFLDIGEVHKKVLDDGSYDYCIEWAGYIDRDNLIYTCYSLHKLEFICDYKIHQNNTLEIKTISNMTLNNDGELEFIDYEEPRYYPCSRWLKVR